MKFSEIPTKLKIEPGFVYAEVNPSYTKNAPPKHSERYNESMKQHIAFENFQLTVAKKSAPPTVKKKTHTTPSSDFVKQ